MTPNESGPTFSGDKPLAVLGLIACIAALAFLLVRRELVAVGPAGWAIQAGAVVLWLWARATLGRRSLHPTPDPTPGGLVMHGPYRWWRHPLYAAIIWFTFATAVSRRTEATWAALLLVCAGLGVRMWAEERRLARAFPADYPAHAARTKRLLPGVW
jgi:protein-S-isoprenylcysteine O-methyltransferase Ste14